VAISGSHRVACVVGCNNPHLNVTMRLVESPFQTTELAALQGFPERMMGLEPTTFCMASERRRSHPFAPVRSTACLRGIWSMRANVNEPERTTSVTIVTTRVHASNAFSSLPASCARPVSVRPAYAAAVIFGLA